MWEREKTYLLFTLAQVSHEEKYFAEKEVFESKYFFFGWCQNIHILSPSLWHNILILWATMYEFNLHNILYRRKKCVCPSSVIFFFLKQPWFASIMTLSKTFSHLNFLNAYNAILKFQLICNQTPRFTIGDCAAGHRADNRDKNRNVLIVPRKLNLFVTNSNFRAKSNLLKSILNMCNTTEL